MTEKAMTLEIQRLIAMADAALAKEYAAAHPFKARWLRLHRRFCLHPHKPNVWAV